jgi:hypothetical protein
MKSKAASGRPSFLTGALLKGGPPTGFDGTGILMMRALLLGPVALLLTSSTIALADTKLPARTAPGAAETRYFTSIDGLMEGNADVILKEARQGKQVTAATLDVCYPVDKSSGRKDRFVVNLAVSGQTLSGTTTSLVDKAPVSIKLTRKATGDTFEFRGQIAIGQSVTEVASTDNSDISEREFQDSQSTDDGITPQPKDFSEVSPESVGVRIKLDAALDFLKSLKGQDVEIGVSSLAVTCDAMRAGQQTINLSVDPERASAVIEKARSFTGVTAAGWTTGLVEMDRAIRIAAADWRDGDKIDRDRLAAAIGKVLGRTLAAQPSAASWSTATGKLKLSFKRPSQLYPALGLTETIEVTGLVAPDHPGGSDRLIVWIGAPVISTSDESAGAKLILSEDSSGEDEGDQKDDSGSIDALAKELKGQRWDSDKSVWK